MKRNLKTCIFGYSYKNLIFQLRVEYREMLVEFLGLIGNLKNCSEISFPIRVFSVISIQWGFLGSLVSSWNLFSQTESNLSFQSKVTSVTSLCLLPQIVLSVLRILKGSPVKFYAAFLQPNLIFSSSAHKIDFCCFFKNFSIKIFLIMKIMSKRLSSKKLLFL